MECPAYLKRLASVGGRGALEGLTGLIVGSIVCLNDLKIAPAIESEPTVTPGDLLSHSRRELLERRFSFKSVKVSRVRCYCLYCMAVCTLAHNLFQSERKYLFELYIEF